MKKVLTGAILGFIAMFAMMSCKVESDGTASSAETGSLKVVGSESQSVSAAESRSLVYSELSIESVTVSGYGMDDVSASSTSLNADGSGTAVINDIPCGKNRVVSVVSNKTGAVLRGIVSEIKADVVNEAAADWSVTAKASVFYYLIKKGYNVSSLTGTEFDSAIDTTVHASLINAEQIAQDYMNGSLSSKSSYILSSGIVKAAIYGKSGKTVQIADPSSKVKTLSGNSETLTFTDVYPGTWNIYIDGTKAGTLTVASGETADFSYGIDPSKVIVFVKCANAAKIYLWGNSTETKYAGEYPGSALTAVPSGYMNDSTGWLCYDFTSTYNNEKINFILLNSSDGKITGDVKTSKTATFWYEYADGGSNDKYYDEDPTKPAVDTNVKLSDIKVNGVSIGASATTYTIGKNVTSAAVTAEAESSSAVVTVSGNSEIASGSSSTFTITVTNNGASASYTLTVSRAAANDVSLSAISVNSKTATISGTTAICSITGTDDSLSITSITATPADSDAVVTYSATTGTVADGASKTFTITVTNGTASASYTLTVSYTKQSASTSSYYWTNKNGAVGSNKTISSWSDWTEAERIAQCAAYDDPRTWKGNQEVPYDVYALYAAYDDTNLYIMAELTNIADRASFMGHDYAGSDNAWWNNRNCPLGFILNTGKGATATSPALENNKGVIWDAINFSDSEGFDWLFYGSSKFGIFAETGKNEAVGTPGFFHVKDTGYFSYDSDYCLSANTDTTTGTSGITVRFMRQCAVSKTIYYESTPASAESSFNMNRAYYEQTGSDLMASTTYSSCETGNLDMSYWYTIPLSTLGITKAYLESSGIGVRQITPNGGSLMDCCPWDPSMVDVATEACSDDTSTSKEKEDVDNITSAQARIGHM